MTMKRRVIYMDDATWETLREHAARRDESISEHLRIAVTGRPAAVDDDTPEFLRLTAATRITGHDAFAELRPAPKPARRRKA